MFGIGKKKANPTRDFEASIKRAVSIASLVGVTRSEMSAVMSDWIVSWERQALMARERRQYGPSTHKIVNVPD